ncbi:uncharacterized protein EAF02_010422 [Botrytis sinoallii]|uniref:uncharacterized protein n=1 Tax=Botrytis sinoallii TaxID=1463999 RepID=UPI001900EFA7|nr:uncharacterized protein EAF02_010422 [Botrytis sinoallii]KAF7862873.1 hypothetical protein EAF02_010422 [Botrytis sinoallii]
MSLVPARSRPSRKSGEADLRASMNRSESMDPTTSQFVSSQPSSHNKRGSISGSSVSLTSPPPPRGHRAEVFDNRNRSQSLQDWMETRITQIIRTVRDTTSIPQQVQDNIGAELQKFLVDFAAQQVFVTQSVEFYQTKLRDLESQLQEAYSESGDHSGELSKCELLAIIASQREELQLKENQLNGKRILWLASHPPASQQRGDPNPLGLPSLNGRSQSQLRLEAPSSYSNSRSGYRGSGSTSMARLSRASLAAMESAAVGGQASPTQEEYNRVKASVSVAVPDSALENVQSISNLRNNLNSETETVINHHRSQLPLVPYREPPAHVPSVHEISVAFTKDFSDIFALAEGWARTYCCIPNIQEDRAIASSNQALWNYMTKLTYNDPQSAHSHVMALLSSENTRFWFTFEQYNNGVAAHLASIREQLTARPLASAEKRQKLVAEQSAVVKSVVNSPDFAKFRNDSLTNHTKHLRDILGPLMNEGTSKSKAGTDLGAIIIASMDLCCRMWTAKLSFQVIFPELLGNKFTAGTMIAKDHPRDNPYQLQTKQKRLKLVMTPSITMRDDNSITIIAKSLHKASVLLMT